MKASSVTESPLCDAAPAADGDPLTLMALIEDPGGSGAVSGTWAFRPRSPRRDPPDHPRSRECVAPRTRRRGGRLRHRRTAGRAAGTTRTSMVRDDRMGVQVGPRARTRAGWGEVCQNPLYGPAVYGPAVDTRSGLTA
jgi:hypothetical protein